MTAELSTARSSSAAEARADYPQTLCSLPGDFGFDPLRLGENPEALKWCAALLAAGLDHVSARKGTLTSYDHACTPALCPASKPLLQVSAG